MFKLRFSEKELAHWSNRYPLTEDGDLRIERDLVPRVRSLGYLTKDDLIIVGNWKSPRIRKHLKSNSEEYIKVVTQASLGSNHEQFRIESLALLRGVSWPMASVILHHFHTDQYPILDFRALWSLSVDEYKYGFEFWSAYTQFCRKLSSDNGLSMRDLDRALWQYSREHQ